MCFVFITNRFLHQKVFLGVWRDFTCVRFGFAFGIVDDFLKSWFLPSSQTQGQMIGATKDKNVLCSPKFFGPFRLSFATNPASPRAGLVSLLKAFNHYLSTGFTNQSKACNSDRLTAVFVFVASSFLVFYNAYLAKAWDRVRWWIFQINRTSHVTFCYVPRTTGNEAAVCMVTQRLIENNSIRRYK